MYVSAHSCKKEKLNGLLNQQNQVLCIILAVSFQVERGDDKHMSQGMFTFIIGKKELNIEKRSGSKSKQGGESETLWPR